MKCYICGKDNVQLEYRRGKGKADVKKVIIGGLLTAGAGGVGAAIGLTDLMTQKCYMRCPDCGYDQFGDFSAKNIMDPKNMVQLEVFYDNYGIPMPAIKEQLENEAARNAIPVRVRFAEFLTGVATGPTTIPCIVFEHPNHLKDYGSFCIVPGRGNYSGDEGFFVFIAGESKQLKKIAYNEEKFASHGAGWATAAAGMIRGGSWGVGTAIGGLAFEAGHGAMVGATKALNALTLDRRALDQEYSWYAQAREIMDSVLGF